MRQEKRKALKRKRDEAGDAEEDDDIIKNIKIDKDLLVANIDNGQYDIALHFSKKLAFELEKKTKAKSF